MQVKNVARPRALNAPQGGLIQSTFGDLSYRGDLVGGADLIYIGYARPGSATSAPCWQIKMITYSGTTPVSILWPTGSDGAASNDFDQIWDNRASLTYT